MLYSYENIFLGSKNSIFLFVKDYNCVLNLSEYNNLFLKKMLIFVVQ